MFPARHESMLSIHATDINGYFADFNPPRTQNDGTVFGTLGIHVACPGMGDSGDCHGCSSRNCGVFVRVCGLKAKWQLGCNHASRSRNGGSV